MIFPRLWCSRNDLSSLSSTVGFLRSGTAVRSRRGGDAALAMASAAAGLAGRYRFCQAWLLEGEMKHRCAHLVLSTILRAGLPREESDMSLAGQPYRINLYDARAPLYAARPGDNVGRCLDHALARKTKRGTLSLTVTLTESARNPASSCRKKSLHTGSSRSLVCCSVLPIAPQSGGSLARRRRARPGSIPSACVRSGAAPPYVLRFAGRYH